MSTDAFTGRLSEYLDGGLAPEERAEIDAHLEGCGGCRTTLAGLREVVSNAQGLQDSAPDRDLWSGIAARIAGRAPARVSPLRRAITSRFTFTLPELAAAALALMVLSGGLVWLARSGDSRADFEPISAAARTAAGPSALTGAQYEETVADLQRTLDERRARLDAGTLRVLDEELATADREIDEYRRALAADPGDPSSSARLAAARQRKLVLLRKAIALSAGR
jgi:anti-sigma factor RsiW